MNNLYYIKRINIAIDYIEDNLENKLTLAKLSEVAALSKYHFHRIFKIITGETLNEFIKRRKMEKACRLLINSKSKSITEIAFECGYGSSSNFTRDFSEFYNAAPSKMREKNYKPYTRKIANGKSTNPVFLGVSNIPEYEFLYSRISNGYNPAIIQMAFKALYQFALKKNLFVSPEQFIGIGYDDPDYTPVAKCRYDAGLILKNGLPKDTDLCGFNRKKIKNGVYAVFEYEGKGDKFFNAWDVIFTKWLLKSKYVPANNPHLEMYKASERYAEGIYKADLCLPVRVME